MRDESRQARFIRGVQHLRELPCEHRRCADIKRLAGLNHFVERFHRLFDRRFIIEAVDLIKVHIIGLQTPQAVIDGMHDVLARKPALVGIVAHGVEDLGRNHDTIA